MQRLFLLVPLIALTACEPEDSKPEPKPIKEAPKVELQEGTLGSMSLHVYGDIYLAGQPTPEDLEEAKIKGFRTILNLRTRPEITWDERGKTESLGMNYLHIPFGNPDELTSEVYEKVRAVLRDSSNEPILVHCTSGNRVGAVWLVHRVRDDGLPFATALKEARRAGLGSDAYVERAKEYLRR